AGADLDAVGEWGNTALYFLLRWWDIEREPRVKQGILWLLNHGADPNVVCAEERETSLHVGARRGQSVETIRVLLAHGADVNARRGDGRTACFSRIAAALMRSRRCSNRVAPSPSRFRQ